MTYMKEYTRSGNTVKGKGEKVLCLCTSNV